MAALRSFFAAFLRLRRSFSSSVFNDYVVELEDDNESLLLRLLLRLRSGEGDLEALSLPLATDDAILADLFLPRDEDSTSVVVAGAGTF